MKYLKFFEDNNKEPKVGDYIIFYVTGILDDKHNNFVNYTVHKITQITWNSYKTSDGLDLNKSYLLDFSDNKRKLQQLVKIKKHTDKFNI